MFFLQKFKGNTSHNYFPFSITTIVTPGQSILAADGSLVLTVLSCDVAASEVTCRIENSCAIGERKNMNLPGVVVDLPTLTAKDIDDIVQWGIPNKIDFIAASFVRKAEDVIKIQQILKENGGEGIHIISKIENQEGMENYEEILKVTDAVMVARGDLGMEVSLFFFFTRRHLRCNILLPITNGYYFVFTSLSMYIHGRFHRKRYFWLKR